MRWEQARATTADGTFMVAVSDNCQAHRRDARRTHQGGVAPGEGFHLLVHAANPRRAAEGGDMSRRILRDLLRSSGYGG
jgi:hypothetical protein